MTGLSPQDATTLFILAIIFLVIARRSYLAAIGTPLSPLRLWGSAALFVALFGVVAVDELFYIPFYAVLAEGVLVALVAILAAPYVERRVAVYRDASGGWSYRVGIAVPAIYLLLFAVRIAMDLAVLGVDPFGPPAPGLSFTPTATALLVAVDALYATSTGLLVARALAVHRRYRRAVASGPGAAPSEP